MNIWFHIVVSPAALDILFLIFYKIFEYSVHFDQSYTIRSEGCTNTARCASEKIERYFIKMLRCKITKKNTSNNPRLFNSPDIVKSCAEYSHSKRLGSSVPSIFLAKCSSISLIKNPYLSRAICGVFVSNLKSNSAICCIGPIIDFFT